MSYLNTRLYYKAKDAKVMADMKREEIESKYLEEIFDKIDSEIKCGQYECQFVELNEFQQTWLKENGYIVTVIDKPGSWLHDMINVSWK